MTSGPKRFQRTFIWCASTAVAMVFIAAVVFAVKALISDDGLKRKRQIHMVTLLKPPPPPKIEERPPEPEIKKKEEIIEPEPEKPEPEETDDQSRDETPPGDELGLDADGTGGSDGFGLKAKKGGRALIGGLGESALLRKYGWYTRIMQKELRKLINDHMEKNGGIPDGDLRIIVQISLDTSGNIVNYSIQSPCGNPRFDEAVVNVLGYHRFSEPPPQGMPKTLKVKISSKA
ncbi:MAG: TonB family protein [Desulfatiglandaceae bacterium]